MWHKFRFRISYANVAATTALTIAVAGTAIASIPAPGGVIKGCYKKSNGTLRVIDSTKKCASSEKTLSWNNKGPAGQPGQPGRPGISEAFSRHQDAAVTVQNTVDVAHLIIPSAGNYVAFAKAWVENHNAMSAALIQCNLRAETDGDYVRSGLESAQPTNAAAQAIALNVVHTFTQPGEVDLSCTSGAAVAISTVKITALRVDQLTNTSQP